MCPSWPRTHQVEQADFEFATIFLPQFPEFTSIYLDIWFKQSLGLRSPREGKIFLEAIWKELKVFFFFSLPRNHMKLANTADDF